jgi:hypothetical protein
MLRVLSLSLLILPLAAHADCIELIEFEIEDQFKEKHTHDELLGQTTILVWADRKGAEKLDIWNAALEESLEGYDVRTKPLAHVKGVPGWIPGLKGKIRGRFSEDPAEWALMDWDGKFAKAYDLTEDTVNVLVFDAGGCMLGRVSGDSPDPVLIQALREFMPESLTGR